MRHSLRLPTLLAVLALTATSFASLALTDNRNHGPECGSQTIETDRR